MSTPPRPRGARPMPMSGGSLLNIAPPTSSSYSPVDLFDSPNDGLNTTPPSTSSGRPRLGLQMPGGRSADPAPTIVTPGSEGSGFSLRPDVSLVYRNAPVASSSKPKLGLSLGGSGGGAPQKPSLKLGLAIPSGGGRSGPDSAGLDSYYGILPGKELVPPPLKPSVPTLTNLTTPMTEPFSAETLRPPLATIVPSTNGAAADGVSELQKAIAALHTKDPEAPETHQETIQYDSTMFETIRRLGEGTGGAVYQVQQKTTGRMMAMKASFHIPIGSVGSAMDH